MSAQTHQRVRERPDGWFPLGPPATRGAMEVRPCPAVGQPHEAHGCRDACCTWWCPGWPEVGA